MKKSLMENVIFCAVIFSIGNYGVHETSCRRVTRRGEGGGLPFPFLKIGKKCPNLEKKCADCGHLQVEFVIQNKMFKSFQEKNPEIFTLRGFSFSCNR